MLERKVTNVWSLAVPPGTLPAGLTGESRFETCSLVVVESTLPPQNVRTILHPGNIPVLEIEMGDLTLNMPAGRIAVNDGMVREIDVGETRAGSVRVRVFLERAVDWQIRQVEGVPARTVILLDREPVRRLLKDRVVAIDPAHGGRDRGARGPINLVEKNVVLNVGQYLQRRLAVMGASGALLRQKDEEVSPAARARVLDSLEADCLILLHTAHERDRKTRGVRTSYHAASPGSRRLAEAVHGAVLEKMALPDRGCRGRSSGEWPPGGSPPAVVMETACLANPLEEAFMRDPVFKDRYAQAIVNGLGRFFAMESTNAAGREE